jgi:glycosyltransferase involved in cell wall biosynthesis
VKLEVGESAPGDGGKACMSLAYLCADRGIPLLGFKGASVHMREMAGALAARGHRVTVLTARLGEGNDAPKLVRVEPLPADSEALAGLLERMRREGAVDAVLERYSLDSGVGREATAWLGIPHVLEVNAPLVFEAARYRGATDVDAGLAREIEAFRSADAVVAVSGFVLRHVAATTGREDVALVPNGVDPARFAFAPPAPLGLPNGAGAVGFIGSMKPWHGVHDLVAAFAVLAARRENVHLVLVGTGPEEEAIRSMASSPRLRGRVHLQGAVAHRDVPGILATLSVAVAPYPDLPDFYFSPLKVLEYMAAGVPVVYARVGDLPAIVQGAGLAYPPGDVDALAASIERVLADAGLRHELGAAGRARALELTWDRAAERVEDVIRPLVRRARSLGRV